jgi:hypothetical protein
MPRPVDRPTSDALVAVDRRQPFEWPFAACSKIFEVYFPSNSTVVDVAHGMGEIPIGMVVLSQVGGIVYTPVGNLWTKDVAYLLASANGTRALLVFVTARENTVDA